MSVPIIRTLTLGIADPHPLSAATIEQGKIILQQARERYRTAGYEVQTVRISTRSLFADLPHWSPGALLKYAQALQQWLDAADLEYCSLGPVPVASPAFPLERLDLLADILVATHALSATVQLATASDGLRLAAAQPTARIIQRLAQETPEGFGNFRFAMLACVGAGSPFFPAAYHMGPRSLSIGLQGASILTDTLKEHVVQPPSALDLTLVTAWVREALIAQGGPIVALGQKITQEQGLHFGGIDLSPAPMGDNSIVTALELCGYGPIGSMGTLAVVAALTSALKSTTLPTCGYCGLMLPVLEDAVLGRRWAQGNLNAHQLLLYSAVCGTGLDTLPLPGDCTLEVLAHLLLDVATLALRLQKPLSARLFPVPGKHAGEHTAFTSPYLVNTIIQNP